MKIGEKGKIMGLKTYKTVTFNDRLTQAKKQICNVERKIEKRIPQMETSDKEFLKQCLDELRDSRNTLLILRKEILYYIAQ